jgi:DNA-binding CsgD family transcriptional regulator
VQTEPVPDASRHAARPASVVARPRSPTRTRRPLADCERGDVTKAGALYREALGIAWTNSDRLCVRLALPGLAGLAVLEGDSARALRLAGAASALEQNAGIVAFPPIRARQEQWLAPAHEALDAVTRDMVLREGNEMTWEEMMAYAHEPTVPGGAMGAGSSASGVSARGRLSRREREVLALVAEGMSNREIAGALVISENTAKYHVAQLLNKLGASSRAEAVTRAVGSGFLAPTAE